MTGKSSTSPHAMTVFPSEPGPPPRLALVPDGTGPHRIDGMWWPYSRDLTYELPLLLTAMDACRSRINRVTVNESMWTSVPRVLLIDGRIVHVGSFTNEQDTQEICLLAYGVGRWDLLVIPPSIASATATRLMANISALR